MRKLICVAAASLLIACAASAQEGPKEKNSPAPNLSGKWVMDINESYNLDGNGHRHPVTPIRLTIEHREPELKMTKTIILKDRERTEKLVYYTDGRGETNPAIVYGNSTDKTKTNWEGHRLVIRGTHRIRSMGSSIDQDFTEKWELSADGKVIEQTVLYDSLPEDGTKPSEQRSPLFMKVKRIFKRAE